MRLLLLAGSILLAMPSLLGQVSPPLPAEEIARIFADFETGESPGCALGIISDQQLVFSRGFGLANLEYSIPIDEKSVFRIGSTSKQFTAASIHLLAEDGKLGLQDDIRRFLPELPTYQTPVTIEHLIHHTSGLRDYLTLMDLAGLRAADYYTDEQVLEMLSRQKELNFPPGEEFLYSNSGYFLLAEIVKRASGKSLREFARERIFEPLGMNASHFHDRHQEIVPQRASGYRRTRDGFRISMTTLEMIGDGGLFTTIEDLAKWDANFYTRRVGGQDFIEGLLKPSRTNDGKQLDYAAGLRVSEYRGLPTVRHGGSFVGFRAELLRFPEQQLSIACLCNLAQTNPSRLANQVADIVLAEQFTEPALRPDRETSATVSRQMEPTAGEAAKPSRTELSRVEGRYRSPELGIEVEVTVEAGGLRLTNSNPFRQSPEDPFQPAQPLRFVSGRMSIQFELVGEEGSYRFRMNAGRVRNILFIPQNSEDPR